MAAETRLKDNENGLEVDLVDPEAIPSTGRAWIGQLQHAASMGESDAPTIHVTETYPGQENRAYKDAQQGVSNDPDSGADAVSTKVHRFTRPDTSHEELGAGFFYQPAGKQQLNMGRISVQMQNVLLETDAPRQISSNVSHSAHRNQRPDTRQTGHRDRGMSTKHTMSIDNADAMDTRTSLAQAVIPGITSKMGPENDTDAVVAACRTVVIPDHRPVDFNTDQCAGAETSSSLRADTKPPPILPLYEGIQEVRPPFSSTTAAQLQDPASRPQHTASVNAPGLAPFTSSRNKALDGGSTTHQLRPSRDRSSEPQDLSPVPAKITKTRRKSKRTNTAYTFSDRIENHDTTSAPSKEDLMNLVMFRMRKEHQERDMERAIQQAKAAELDDVKGAYEHLRAQLQEIREREETQHAELSKYQKALPGWKLKLRKLDDYLKGLTNDHHNLRDDARVIQKRQDSLQLEKAALETTFGVAHEALSRRPIDTKNILIEARHRIDSLEQTIMGQEKQLERDTNLLDAERERNERLEIEMSKISVKQEKMLEEVMGHRQGMTLKLDSLLKTREVSQTESPSNWEEQSRVVLNRCVGLLQDLHGVEVVKPDELQRLDASVQAYMERITESVQASRDDIKFIHSERHRFEVELQQQLKALETDIKTEQTLTEQVTDLREIKATIRERLQASDESLVEARRKVIDLQNKESQLYQDNESLKAEILQLHNRPSNSPDTIVRLQKVESLNSELRDELAKLQEEFTEVAGSLERRDEAAVELLYQMDTLKTQLADAHAATNMLEEQKSASESEANARYEDMRSQLLKTANTEKVTMANEHANILHQLKQQKAAADSKAEKAEAHIEGIKKTSSNETETINHLRGQLARLEVQGGEHERNAASLHERLRIADEKLQSKDTEIQLMTEDISNKHRQQRELEQRLTSVKVEANSQADNLLTRLNTAFKEFDNNSAVQSNVDEALIYLSTLLTTKSKAVQSGSATSEGSFDNTKANEVLGFSQEQISDDRHGLNARTDTSSQPRRKANRNLSNITNRDIVHEHQDNLIIEESQVKETTVHRSVRKTLSSHGQDEDTTLFDITPSKEGSSHSVAPFSHFQQEYNQSPDPESPLGDLSSFFPPTPVLQSSLDLKPLGSETARNSTSIHHSDRRPLSLRPGRQISAYQSREDRQTQMRDQSLTTRLPASQSAAIDDRLRSYGNDYPYDGSVSLRQRISKEETSASTSTRGQTGAINSRSAALVARGKVEISSKSSHTLAAPRGILKNTRSAKRGATAAGLDEHPKGSKRTSAVDKQGLGPVIPESQSPLGSRSSLSTTKLQSRRNLRRGSQVSKGPKEDKYQRRFSQEFE